MRLFLSANSKRRPLCSNEEHFDTCALARHLKLVSGRFGQSYLQDLDCLARSRVAGLKGVKSAGGLFCVSISVALLPSISDSRRVQSPVAMLWMSSRSGHPQRPLFQHCEPLGLLLGLAASCPGPQPDPVSELACQLCGGDLSRLSHRAGPLGTQSRSLLAANY